MMLSFGHHTKYLSQQIAKYSGMFYRLRNYPKKMLCASYYSHIYSRVTYGIITRENAAKTYLNRVSLRMSDMLRAINFSPTYQNVNNLRKNFELLQFPNIYRLELAKFVYKLEHNKFPQII